MTTLNSSGFEYLRSKVSISSPSSSRTIKLLSSMESGEVEPQCLHFFWEFGSHFCLISGGEVCVLSLIFQMSEV